MGAVSLAHPAAAAIATIVLLLLGARTIVQTEVWQNDVTLFKNALRVYPDSFLARNNLGRYYVQTKHPDLAMRLFQEAVVLRRKTGRCTRTSESS